LFQEDNTATYGELLSLFAIDVDDKADWKLQLRVDPPDASPIGFRLAIKFATDSVFDDPVFERKRRFDPSTSCVQTLQSQVPALQNIRVGVEEQDPPAMPGCFSSMVQSLRA
jgi:hypothetical protein